MRRSRALGSLALLAACAGPPKTVGPGVPGPQVRPVEASGPRGSERPGQPPVVPALPRPTGLQDAGTGPGVLLPSARPEDQVVTRIAGFEIHKSHLYDRQLEEDPLATRAAVDRLVFDVLIAQEALKHKIEVDPGRVARIVKEEEERLSAQVAKDWDGRISLEQFLRNTKDVDLKTFRVFLRRHMARRLYRYYVIRFLGMQEDRVEVRLIRMRDQARIRELRKKVLDGADFRSLARRESEHSSQRRGGLLEPFARGAGRSFAAAAFKLAPGEVSPVLSGSNASGVYYDLVYCVRHHKRRQESFAELRAELGRDWLKTPISREESFAAYLRLRTASEGLNNAGRKR